MIWFWHQVNFLTSLISLCFLTFSIIFPKTELFINLKKPFSKSCFAFYLRSVFISIYGFSQAFWLNLITLWTFFKANPWFNPCFKFLMCRTYSVLSCKLSTSFLTFSIYILSGKNSKSLWGLWNSFSVLNINFKNFLDHFLHSSSLSSL